MDPQLLDFVRKAKAVFETDEEVSYSLAAGLPKQDGAIG